MKPVTDVHVHIAALPTAGNGVRISKRMLKSPLARFLLWKLDLPLEDPETANRRYLDNLHKDLEDSSAASHAVLLAMDGVYGSDGRLDEGHTDFLMPNDLVFESVKGRPRLLPGASIHPNRGDAIEEAERCAALGAALVKVLPNAQVFDPADRRFRPLWRKLAELRLPVLTHVGYEFSLIGQDQSVGDLERWRSALEEGCSVIAAHGCSTGVFFFEKHLQVMLELISKYPHFYIDTSALTLPNRVGTLMKLRRMPEVFDRLLFGTDYPLPCFAYPALLGGSVGGYGKALVASTRFDRQRAVLDSLGVPAGRDFLELFPRLSRGTPGR